jgi:hypothetical protein
MRNFSQYILVTVSDKRADVQWVPVSGRPSVSSSEIIYIAVMLELGKGVRQISWGMRPDALQIQHPMGRGMFRQMAQ